MTANVNKLNKLVLTFFEENADAANFEELWMDASVQKQVKLLLSSSKSSGGGRKKKDVDAPKRGKSAYLFFCAEFRNAVKTDLGAESKATDVTRELGARWNIMKDSKKPADKKALSGFEKAALADKERYAADKAVYVPPENDDADDSITRRGGKKKTVKDGPKRGQSAYLYFCSNNRAQVKDANPEFKATEVTSALGKMWNELKDDASRSGELAAFEAQAAEDKARYETEKAEFGKVSPKKAKASPKKATTTKAAPEGKGKVAPKKATTTKAPPKSKKASTKVVEESDLGEDEELLEEEDVVPKAKSQASSDSKKQNSYQLFCADKRTEMKEAFPKAKPSEVTKKLSAAWKALSKDEQQAWKSSA